MKKRHLILAALTMTGCLTATAATVSDTLIIENVNKMKIETRDTVQRIVISGTADDPDFHYVQRIAIADSNAVRRELTSVRDFNKIAVPNKEKPEDSTIDAAMHINMGLGTMTGAPDGYSFKLWPSPEIGFGFTGDWHPYGKKNIWSLGLGLDWRMYRSSRSTYWAKDHENVMYLENYGIEQSHTRTTLHVFSLQVPLLYTHYFDEHQRWGFTLGGLLNFNTGASAHRHYELSMEDYDVKTGSIGQRPITVDAVVAVHIPSFPSIYCKYSPTKFFRNSRGPAMHQLSFGICF